MATPKCLTCGDRHEPDDRHQDAGGSAAEAMSEPRGGGPWGDGPPPGFVTPVTPDPPDDSQPPAPPAAPTTPVVPVTPPSGDSSGTATSPSTPSQPSQPAEALPPSILPPPEAPPVPEPLPEPVSYVPESFKDSTAYQEGPSTWERHWELVYQRQLGQDDEDTENREALDQYLKQNPEADSETILQQALVTGNLRAAFAAAKADAESRGEEWNQVYVGPEERAIEADYQAFLANLAAEDKETWTAHADNIAQIALQDPATAYFIKKRFRLLSAYGLSSRSHTIRYKQTEPRERETLTFAPRFNITC